ncbi:hypothetical protein DdX_01455 [Ditylenchus destructor]|uniref:Uncharacterized protein n=1 Tax=Ditylenchus destructor TaxID=166010 RepID=A0AAD4RB80_9BILA|nr:hypothetical protein DdX_01455 [Ditylenchus destructor]
MYSYMNGSGNLLALIEQLICSSRLRRCNKARAGSAQLTQTRASRVFQEIISDVDKKQLMKVMDDAKVPLRRLSRTKRFQIPLCNGTNLLLLPPQGEIYVQQRGYRTSPIMSAANRGFRAKKTEPEMKESFLAKLANSGRKSSDNSEETMWKILTGALTPLKYIRARGVTVDNGPEPEA